MRSRVAAQSSRKLKAAGARSARHVRAALNTGLSVAMLAPLEVWKTSLAVEPMSGLAEHGRAIPTTWKRVIRSGRMLRSRAIPSWHSRLERNRRPVRKSMY